MKQTAEVTLMNLRSIPNRLGISLVICFGTASVVAVLVTVLSMATGLTDTIASGADPGRAIVMRKGALAESMSSLTRAAVFAVETAPGLVDVDGHTGVSPEVVLSVDLPRLDGTGNSAIFVRGLTATGWALRPEIQLVQGRSPEPGLFEVLVGRSAQRQFANLDLADEVDFHSSTWRVVGVFANDGAVTESQLITDAPTLMAAANRSVFSTATVRFTDTAGFEAFRAALENDPKLVVSVLTETDYYDEQAESFAQVLQLVAYVVSSIMALGALFGGVNTMYTAVAARTAEIATLRAIGFGATPVVTSVLIEALVLSLVGALLGALVAWTLFNGTEFVTGGTVNQIGVQLTVGAPIIATGIIWACAIGLLAGFFPALRAARMPVAAGLMAG